MVLLMGDIQGCCSAFERLLGDSGFSPSRDRLVVLGDLVNRGPDSLGVLRRLRGMDDAVTCLLGNHDLHLLAAAHGLHRLHRGDTFCDVLQAPDRQRWLDWLCQRPLAHVECGWLCVHAGVPPAWDAPQTLARAEEVQALLRSADLPGFLQAMYGNEPARWDPALTGHARHRFIVNAFTRMRWCAADGTLDFETKEGAAAAPPGLLPWFEVPGRGTQGQPVAFGHWSTLGLVNRPDLLGLDTGCVWGGSLTAVRVDGGRREVLQVKCDAAQVPGCV